MGPAWLDGLFAHPKPTSLVCFHTTFTKKGLKKMNSVITKQPNSQRFSFEVPEKPLELAWFRWWIFFVFVVLFSKEIEVASLNNPF